MSALPNELENAVCALHGERLRELEAWQTRQNGSLQRLEDKMDGLRNWLMGATFSALLAIVGITFTLLHSLIKK